MKFFKKYKSLLLLLFGFFVGSSLSSGLLIYSGKELVNVFVYFSLVVLFPFVLTLFSFLTYLKKKTNRYFYHDSFLFGVFFSFGALVSLVFMVTTRDIAFGWATTIDVSSSTVYNFISAISFWKVFFPSAVPTLSLVEISHFARLGSGLTKEQIDSAVLLGQWWKFLAFSILFYGVIFRGFLYLIFTFNRDKNIEFESLRDEEEFKELELKDEDIKLLNKQNIKVKNLIGYDIDEISLKNIKIDCKNIIKLGGKNRFEDDCKTLGSLKGDSLLVVKSWEPPVLDFIDLLECFEEKNFYIYLLGLKESAKKSELNMWKRKLQEYEYKDIEVLS